MVKSDRMSKGITNIKLASGEAYLEALGPKKGERGRDFLKAVWGGDFDIALKAKSLPLERSYHILAGPPPSIIRQFIASTR
jgi:hypothetical protein